ncbi:DUF5677 domain-containing protein [Alicyclobacillus fastidiosus]|uniref:DUF5677 domain-containing protein n=1 Tax=Alicyclobacillus fastidiosus TaxID=392011 RepID=A0ABV5AIB6_9BACL|nr:DUF5677 domain-containing protein [Alicyclobacillus fastidiosus]WEH11134.1 DUF5677 domain-containing protein [Alicyclobacillus fastidiosus]
MERIIRLSRQMIDSISRDSELYDELIVFQVKSHRMLKSTLILADAGYAVECEAFIRSMQELLVTAKYMLLDPRKHSEMYRTFRWIEKWKQVEDLFRGAEMSLQTDSLTLTDMAKQKAESYQMWMQKNKKMYDEAVSKRTMWAKELKENGYRNPKNTWSLKSPYDMAIDSGIGHIYLSLYSTMSHLVHPSTLSIFKYIDNGKIKVEPSDKHVDQSIIGACGFHLYITQLIAGFYEFESICEECENISLKLSQMTGTL